MPKEVVETAWSGASEEWVDVTVRLPKRYTVQIFAADNTVDVDVDSICPNGHTILYLYGLGRKLRDGAGQTYAKDKKGECIETPEGKKAKSMAHAETRYADLQSGEITTRISSVGVSTYITYLKQEVIRFAHNTLGITLKSIGKLGDTEEGIKAYCDTLKGCPWDAIKSNAKMQADMQDGIKYTVQPEDVENAEGKPTKKK